jgi:hypothetical protein
LVSDEVRDKEFVCNLEKCKGACCVEGDFGAPLLEEELAILEEIYPKVKPYLSARGIEEIERQGTHTIDDEDELVTPVIAGRECVYAVYDNKGILKCGIEAAYNAGAIGWKKPISCHLYPIRLTKVGEYIGLEYHRWDICHCARQKGKKMHLPLYQFLKEPLIRRFGQAWYDELELTASEWKKQCAQK